MTNQETCANCGHEKGWHREKCIYIDGYCPCKKFVSQNQSQEIGSKKVSAPDTLQGIFYIDFPALNLTIKDGLIRISEVEKVIDEFRGKKYQVHNVDDCGCCDKNLQNIFELKKRLGI